MTKTIRVTIPVLLTVTLLIVGQNANAADCKDVSFKIQNNTGDKIKLKRLRIYGNKGHWDENIRDKVLKPGESFTTNKRRMNKLDSGYKITKLYAYYKMYSPPSSLIQAPAAAVEPFPGPEHRVKFENMRPCSDGLQYFLNLGRGISGNQ